MSRKLASIAGLVAFVILAVWLLAIWRPEGHRLAAARLDQSAASAKVVTLRASIADDLSLISVYEKLILPFLKKPSA